MKIYECKCGKKYNNSQSYAAHCGHCKIKQGHEIKDRFGKSRSHKNKKMKRKLPDLNKRLILGRKCNSNHLKFQLIKQNYKEYKCENCGLSKWLDKKIPLELHHINGNKKDNRIENIKLLCPNCHALTDNYRGRNIKDDKSK